MVFCNIKVIGEYSGYANCHNPYFNRWFSAIQLSSTNNISLSGHNPYFNRWFSAIARVSNAHNIKAVTILILIDGFLQCSYIGRISKKDTCHNPYFNRWFSAINI